MCGGYFSIWGNILAYVGIHICMCGGNFPYEGEFFHLWGIFFHKCGDIFQYMGDIFPYVGVICPYVGDIICMCWLISTVCVLGHSASGDIFYK